MSEAAAAWQAATECGMNISRKDIRKLLDAASRARARKRAGRKRDAAEIASAAVNIAASLAARATAGDLDALTGLAHLADRCDAQLGNAVHGLRAQGYSDMAIARAVGVSSETIGRRYGRRSASARSPGELHDSVK